jgi:hypothetical protein
MARNAIDIKNGSTLVAAVSDCQTAMVGFDYTQLDPGSADFLRDAATQIRCCKESWGRAIIRIGMTLQGAKAHLPHGQFGDWLKKEFDMSERTAENYMSVAKEFGSKSETVADLPPNLLYKLAARSTPKGLRQKVIGDLEAGKSIEPRTLTKEIAVSSKKGLLDKFGSAEKAAQKAALILAKLSPDERQELLRLLRVPAIRSFLDDEILKCEKARARSGNWGDERKAAPTYCPSIHEMGGPGRGLPKSIHEVPESEVAK